MKGNLLLLGLLLVVFPAVSEGTTVTCDTQYGFLPCSTDFWGRVFLIVVYQYMMSLGQQYISQGSDLFFSIVGPGIFGASLFHILGSFPMLLLILESGLTHAEAGAEQNAEMGMSVLAGSAVMSLTLIWPSCVAFGSFDLSDDSTSPQLPADDKASFWTQLTGYGVSTDNETTNTARILLVSMIPFVILNLPKMINSPSATRVIVLIALIATLGLFIVYVVYQVFQPWIQNRRFEYVTQKFVKNKLLRVISSNGKPNVPLIRQIYKGMDKNQDGKVSKIELRLILMGIQLEADGNVSDDFVESIMGQFDISGDESIQEDEFVRVLTKWHKDARNSLSKNDHNPLRYFIKSTTNSDDQEQQQPLVPKVASSSVQGSWWQFLEALALVVIGTVISAVMAQPLIMNIADFASAANVPFFFIPYFVIPCALSIPRAMTLITSAMQKTERAASLTLSQIYSGAFTSNMTSLITFLLVVYIRDLSWDVSAQMLVVMVICIGMGVFTSTRTVFPMWTSFVVYLMYPISLLMLYLLTTVWGWS